VTESVPGPSGSLGPRGPLHGVRVLEVGQYVAGPMAAMMLADLGADVVKVEPPGKGDAFRTYGLRYEGYAAFWVNVNRGKRSVALDLKDARDAERCRELARRADILLLTSRPGVLDDVGLDDDTLASLNPALVRVYVTGYGSTGPRASEPVYDNLVQGLSGLAAFQSGNGVDDVLAPMVVDKTTSFLVAQAAIAALYEQRVTGVGRRVEVSLLDVAAYWNFPDMFQDRTFVDDDKRITRLGSSIVTTTDGRIIVSPVTGRQLKNTAAAFGHPEWIDEWKTMEDHTVLMRDAVRKFESVTSTMTTAEALDRLREHDVPAAPVLDLDAHLDDPQVRHNELYATEHDERLGAVRVVRYPARFDGEPRRAPFTAPRPGADRAAVVRDWGLDWSVEDPED
jgi:crotonobetainyl-CoA:carnitine CoA-transferase CaiB-like acyl-CoA transferase